MTMCNFFPFLYVRNTHFVLSEYCLSLSRVGEEDRDASTASIVSLFKDLKVVKEKSTQSVLCKNCVQYLGMLCSLTPQCHQLLQKSVYYFTCILLSNLNLLGRLPLPSFWFSLLQDFLPNSIIQHLVPLHHLPLFIPFFSSCFQFILFSDLIETVEFLWVINSIWWFKCILVQISGRLNVCWHTLCSPFVNFYKASKSSKHIFLANSTKMQSCLCLSASLLLLNVLILQPSWKQWSYSPSLPINYIMKRK